MKQSGVETESEAFHGLDDQGSGQQELFGKAAVRNHSVTGSRLIVSCGDAGLANDYGQFIADKSRQELSPAVTEGLSSDAFIQAAMHSQLRPAEVVIFLNHRITSEVWKLFSALIHLTARTPFTCLLVLPTLRNHLCPSRTDGMQTILDQLADAFRKSTPSANTAFSGPALNSDPGISLGSDSSAHKRQTSRLIVIRTGFVISPSSSMTRRLKRLAGFKKLLLPHLSTTFVHGEKLFSTIQAELQQVAKPGRLEAASSAGSSSELAAREQHNNLSLDEISQGDTKDHPDEFGAASSRAAISARQVTILGTRRTWQSVITELAPFGSRGKIITLATALLAATGIPWLLYFGLQLLSLLIPSLRQIHFDTLKPHSVREIISLYNRHNCRDVQLAGYNNGVNHFGWKFPEKTVVLTTSLPGKTQLSDVSILDLEARIRSTFAGEEAAGEETTGQGTGENPEAAAASTGTHFTVDAGLTLHHCLRELNKLNREFYVVPNYSWISMGTLYFVPVHGSGSHVSTLGDTIEDVLLYDGESEKFILSRRGDTTFRDSMYDTSRNRLLLRLTLRVKQKSVYSVRREIVESPSAEEILHMFTDAEASNVEIRKNKAASTSIDLRRYYADSAATANGALEMPRDSIGRVWDRLEETPIVSWLFHWFVRTFAFHVELFLKPDEFVIFWKHHQTLPISKIQLRQVLKDGITNSACAHENCISADLFMTRSNREVFLNFTSKHLPNVRFNPGKQSL